MVRPRGKSGRQAGGAGKKRSRDEFFEDAEEADEFFVQSGDEAAGASESEEEDAEAAETAEEKRLRLGAGAQGGWGAAGMADRQACGPHACSQQRRWVGLAAGGRQEAGRKCQQQRKLCKGCREVQSLKLCL